MVLACAIFSLTSCQTTSKHQFSDPAPSWKSKSGQILYAGPKRRLIGEVLVRYSGESEFQLTVTKGPVTLLTLRQDANFGQLDGPLARGGWSGPIAKAPKKARGWLELRELILRPANKQLVKHKSGEETFLLRF